MVLNSNLLGLSSVNNMKRVNATKSKHAERLASGQKLNRAADDVAGLAISEKMRAQIRGLDMAEKNMEEAKDLCTVADGALQNIHDGLHRIKELTIQALNDTNTDQDRQIIQKEIDDLYDKINSIAKRTNYNNIYMLDGDYDLNDFTHKISFREIAEVNVVNRTETIRFNQNANINKVLSEPISDASPHLESVNMSFNSNPAVSVPLDFTYAIDTLGTPEKVITTVEDMGRTINNIETEIVAPPNLTEIYEIDFIFESGTRDTRPGAVVISTDAGGNVSSIVTASRGQQGSNNFIEITTFDNTGNIIQNVGLEGPPGHASTTPTQIIQLANGNHFVVGGCEANCYGFAVLLDRDGQVIDINRGTIVDPNSPPGSQYFIESDFQYFYNVIQNNGGEVLAVGANRNGEGIISVFSDNGTLVDTHEISSPGNTGMYRDLITGIVELSGSTGNPGDPAYLISGFTNNPSGAGYTNWTATLDSNFNLISSQTHGIKDYTNTRFDRSNILLLGSGEYLVSFGNEFVLYDPSAWTYSSKTYSNNYYSIIENADGTISAATNRSGDIVIDTIDLFLSGGTIKSSKTIDSTTDPANNKIDSKPFLVVDPNDPDNFIFVASSTNNGDSDLWIHGSLSSNTFAYKDIEVNLMPMPDMDLGNGNVIRFTTCKAIYEPGGRSTKGLIIEAELLQSRTISETEIRKRQQEFLETEYAISKLYIQSGPNAYQGKILTQSKVSADELFKSAIIKPINVLSWEASTELLNLVDHAASQISRERAKYGSYYNALDMAATSVSTSSICLSYSESQFRDADMAKELMQKLKCDVLENVSMSMLSQANNNQQMVLKLLSS